MLELFLPCFLSICVNGIIGNRADATIVSITQKVLKQVQFGKIVNHDMQKALNRSFLLSLIDVCDICLTELKSESYLQRGNFIFSGQFRWLENKKISVEDELKAVEKTEYKELTNETLDEIKSLLITEDPTSRIFQKIRKELFERTEIGNNKAPECYKKRVEENILGLMCTHFAYEIKGNQTIINILETQLLIQLDIKIDSILDSVPSIVQNLNLIPDMNKKLDDVYCVVQSIPQMLESNQNAPYRMPFQVPSLTEDVIELPELKKEIKNDLLNCNNSSKMLVITAIQGMGGIGKTTFAIVLANDEDVKKHFTDGILWATLGQEPEKLSLLNSWIQALGDYQSNLTTVQTASNHLRTLLHEKRVLLVIDDVWEYGDVEPFLVGGSSCRTIITTRKAYIADDLGAKLCSLNLMTEEQSLELFANILKDSWDQNEKDEALKVAKDVGYLPLALNLAAKRRLRNYSWIKLHEAFEEEIANLSVLESPHSLRKGKKGGIEASLNMNLKRLEASLNLSLKALRSCDEEAWEDFIWLGVLPEDIKINKKMVSTVWDNDEQKAEQILEFLWEEGLLIQDLKIQLWNEELKTYRMHDLFHDIARHYLTCSPSKEKSTELSGLGLKLNEAHASLLNRYKLKTKKKGLWHTLEDDAYILSHLTWHMEKAGQIEDIHNLLIEENEERKNGWYEALESLGQNAVFIENLMRAWNLSEKKSESHVEQGNKTSFIGLEIRYALMYTSINSLSANTPTKLLVTLLETKKWTETKVFIYAQREPKFYTRVTKLIAIHQLVSDGYIKEKVMEKALEIASQIQGDSDRAEALSAIVPHLDGQRKEEVLEKALEIASQIQDGSDRAKVLSRIVPHLDGQRKEEVLEKTLEIASQIQDDSDRAKALSAIVPHLDGQRKEEVLEKALKRASQIQSDYSRSISLSDIAPHLDGQRKEEVLEKALERASVISDDPYREVALFVIVPHLDGQRKEEFMEKALKIVSQIQEENSRSNALSDIVPYLDGQRKKEFMKKAFEIASQIQDNYSRSYALSAIALHLDGQIRELVMERALDIASKIQDDYDRAEALSAIVPHLDGKRKEEVTEKALDIASQIQDGSDRAKVLSRIVPHLDGQRKEVTEKALDIASQIQDDYYRTKALSAIVPHLDGQGKEEVLEKAFEIASQIQFGYCRLKALSIIILHLNGQRKEEVTEKALEIASQIQDDYYRSLSLSAIAPHLDGQRKEKLIEKALEIVSQTQNDYFRANAIFAIVPHLNGQKKEEMLEKALEIASQTQNDLTRNIVFSAIFPHLDGQRKEDFMEKALEIASQTQNDYHAAKALSAIVPHLDGQRKEKVIDEVLKRASQIQIDSIREELLSAIVPYLNGKRKEKVMEEVLEIALQTQYDYYRAKTLFAIIPHLDGKRKEELMKKALDIASKIKDDREIAYALYAIVPHLNGQRKEELMEKAFDIASRIQSDEVRANALCFVLSHMRDSPVNKLYFWWKKIIQILRECTRSDLLNNIIILIPVINCLGKDETLFEISRDIIDVSKWWP